MSGRVAGTGLGIALGAAWLLAGCAGLPLPSQLTGSANPEDAQTAPDQPKRPAPQGETGGETAPAERSVAEDLSVDSELAGSLLALKSTHSESLHWLATGPGAPNRPARPGAAQSPDDLWVRIREGFSLAASEQPRVQRSLRWYRNHPGYLDRVARRARPFLHHIVEAVEARDMPTELALLPVVESAFRPFAYSHGRAAGLWQFIPGTGRRYGLEQNWWYDGRRDVIAATDAALRYLERLHEAFDGDWLLALAAYNSGAGTVRRAVQRNRRAGEPADFWHLDLPRETRGYVPKLLALRELVRDPARYGIELQPLPNEPQIQVVEVDGQLDLAVAADLAGMDLAQLYRLNPGYNRWATAPAGPHRLVLPRARVDRFRRKLAELPDDERIQWARHEIRRGETLSEIAHDYHTTIAVLRRINGLDGQLIRAGEHLLIPTASRSRGTYSLSAAQRRKAVQNRARPGRSKQVHVVQRGESLWGISRRYGVSVRRLAEWNNMAPRDYIRPGQELVVWVDKRTREARRPRGPAQAAGLADLTQRVRYAVRPGDSLYRIARRFRVSVADLRKWNQLPDNDYLQPGQKLTLYVDVRRQSGSG